MSKQLIQVPQTGAVLFGSVKHFNQEKIDRFGAVAGGVGAIHLDPVFGKEKTRYGTTLVQGYLLLGFITELMKNNFGVDWVHTGVMDAKLVGPVVSGDSVITGGEIVRIEETQDGLPRVVCSVWIKNESGATVVAADTAFILDYNAR